MLVVFGFVAFICIFTGIYQFYRIGSCQKVEAVIVDGQYGFLEQLAIRFPVYEYVWNNEICRHVSHFSDDALKTTKIVLFIDKEGRPHELKSVIVPIVCGVVLGFMVVLKAIC